MERKTNSLLGNPLPAVLSEAGLPWPAFHLASPNPSFSFSWYGQAQVQTPSDLSRSFLWWALQHAGLQAEVGFSYPTLFWFLTKVPNGQTLSRAALNEWFLGFWVGMNGEIGGMKIGWEMVRDWGKSLLKCVLYFFGRKASGHDELAWP